MTKADKAVPTPASEPTVTKKPTRTPCDAAGIMRSLWNRAYPQYEMPREDLEYFSGATTVASFMARNLSSVVSGIGCLIATEADAPEGTMRSGNFQDGNDVPTLLFHVAESIEVVAALMDIGSDADCILSQLDASEIAARRATDLEVHHG